MSEQILYWLAFNPRILDNSAGCGNSVGTRSQWYDVQLRDAGRVPAEGVPHYIVSPFSWPQVHKILFLRNSRIDGILSIKASAVFEKV